MHRNQLVAVGKAARVVSLNNEIAKEFVGNNNLNPENNNIAENAKKQANESSKPKSKNETKKPDLSGTIDQIASDWNKRIQTLYDTLREAPICKILEVILKCLTILLNNAGLSFKVGSRKVFTYKELKEQVIPSLTVEQKRIFYNIFITEPCINKKAIIDIFTEVTGSESARYLSSLSYQQAKSQLILKLV